VEKALSDVIAVDDIVSRGFDRLLDPNGDAQKILVEVK
jgi:(R,R)-butanediol dehydrogenase/meso-butanediol dehydrogenase/diacetyl reductase